MKQQINFRASKETRTQLDELTAIYGNQTAALDAAITSLHNSTMRFELQHTGRPFGPTERIPDEAWRTVSRHAEYTEAEQAMTDQVRMMRQACGVGAWDDHFRIIALTDASMNYHCICLGYMDERADFLACPQQAVEVVTVVWPAGETQPGCEVPNGWHSPRQCQSCYQRDAYFSGTVRTD